MEVKISSFELHVVCILQYNVIGVIYMYIFEKVFDMDLCQKQYMPINSVVLDA